MLPHELVSKYLIPELRGLLVHRLNERGLGQLRIAKLLNVSQPMISKYLSTSPTEYLKRLSRLGLDMNEVVRIADLLTENLVNGKHQEYFKLLNTYINSLLREGHLCDYHREVSPSIPKDCNVCLRMFEEIEDPYVEEVKAAYEILSLHPRGFEIIPEVGMNIVSAPPNAENYRDVVGFSGRIIRTNGKIAVAGEPARGGSRHTANVLLTVMRRFPKLRSTIVIKYDRRCIEKLHDMGLKVVKSGPHSSVEEFFRTLDGLVGSLDREPDVIADAGGLGIEPVVYVFSGSAINAIKKALACIE
ncbi:MAG: thiamine-phosphate synthase family protein [Zestosphaera sp.]